MSAERFVFKMFKFSLIAQRREQYPYVPFIFNVKLENLLTDCEFFLPVETVDKSDSWGYHYPACNQDDKVNANSIHATELRTCIDCPLYSEGDPLDLASLRGSTDPDKAAKRKARREARLASRGDSEEVEEPEETEEPEELDDKAKKAAKRKARRLARKAAREG